MEGGIGMNIDRSSFQSIEQLQNQYLNKTRQVQSKDEGAEVSFQSILEQKTKMSQETGLKFSKHAANRLESRNISLTDSQMQRLNEGFSKAEMKGIKDSLVLLDDLAFIVNTKSSTVITAMDQTETSENIFTNIDGAVII